MKSPFVRNFKEDIKLSNQIQNMIKNAERGRRILTSTIRPKKKEIGHRYTGIVSLKDNLFWVNRL